MTALLQYLIILDYPVTPFPLELTYWISLFSFASYDNLGHK